MRIERRMDGQWEWRIRCRGKIGFAFGIAENREQAIMDCLARLAVL
jgi:hypothetical protein